MLENSGKRLITTHPHSGRVFVVGDTLTIHDVWKMEDAYLNVLQNGQTWVNDAGVHWNSGSFRNSAQILNDELAHHEPLAGMSGGPSFVNGNALEGFRFITQEYTSGYIGEFGGEINSQHDSFALSLAFRFLSEDEFGTSATSPLGIGIGARAQRIIVRLWERSNPSASNFQDLIDIFYDWSYYQANVSPAIPAQNASNVLDLNPTQGVPLAQNGAINSALIIDKINAALRKSGNSAAHLQIFYYLPLHPTGATWASVSASGAFDYCHAEPIQNVNSGVTMQSWGVLSATLTLFRSSTYTSPLGVIGANGRVQTAFPAIGDFQVGQNFEGVDFNDLRQMAQAAKGVGWPSFIRGKRDFGGLPRIICGDWARWQSGNRWGVEDTASQVVNTVCQLPQGATRFTLNTLVRFTAGCGLHTITITLERDYTNILGNPATASQTLYTASFATAFSGWVWVDAALSASMIPDQGKVEAARLIFAVTKSVPRTAIVPNLPFPLQTSVVGYWDGVAACYLSFR